jgi:putative ABC transport system permease protein
MFKNYLKTAIRNIMKNKVYSFIIILGFSIGLACVLLISMWVRNELNFDRFHSKGDRIFKVDANASFNNKNLQIGTQTNYTGPMLKKDLPEVEDYLRLYQSFEASIVRSSSERIFREKSIIHSDRVFFSFFDFTLVLGDRETALDDPLSVVISKKMAKKYFFDDNPLGKTLEINSKTYKVTGVIDTESVNSHIKFDFLLALPPFSFKPDEFKNLNLAYLTYVLLKEGINVEFFEKKANKVVNKYIKPVTVDVGLKNYTYDVILRPLEDIYLHSPISHKIFRNSFRDGSVTNIYVMIAAAFIILFIVSFNYVNLTLARSLVRTTEIGVRKINGASKSQIRWQLLNESLVQIVIAFGLTILIVETVLPMFNHITGRNLNIASLTNIFFAVLILSIVVLVAFLSGVYPAVFLSRINSAELIRSKFFSSGTKTMFRKFFIVVQFALSLILIITTFFIAKQIHFMKEKDLGFNKSNKMVLDLSNSEYEKRYPVLKTVLERLPEVESVSVSSAIPGKFGGTNPFNIKGDDAVHLLWMYYVDCDFLPAHGLKLLEGRNFSRDIASDKTAATIINESTARKLGLEKPVGAIIEDQCDKSKYEVVGVIKDFHSESLHEEIRPLIIRFVEENSEEDYKRGKYLTVAIKPGDIRATVANIEKEYNRLIPNQPYEYFFIDDLFNSFYREEERFNNIFFYSASLAIFLSCLGLFGLTTFMVQRRTKEIGIRKVLGASISNITTLLVKSFTKWVVIANILAWPIAYYYISKWLENFAFRTSIGIETFILSAALVLIIAVLTVSFNVIKASLANPVETLKYE